MSTILLSSWEKKKDYISSHIMQTGLHMELEWKKYIPPLPGQVHASPGTFLFCRLDADEEALEDRGSRRWIQKVEVA